MDSCVVEQQILNVFRSVTLDLRAQFQVGRRCGGGGIELEIKNLGQLYLFIFT